MKKRETLFGERVDRDLRTLKRAWFTNIQQVAIRGIPDRVGVVNGQFVAIELKTNTGVLDALQRYVLTKIREAGGYPCAVTPDTWDKCFETLQELDEPSQTN